MNSSKTLALLALTACGNGAIGDDSDASTVDAVALDALPSPVRLADRVVAAPGASGSGFGDPQRAINGIHGGGQNNGSTDVYSLRFAPAPNESITLGWIDAHLANGPGPDLAVFENGFDSPEGPFMDLVIVEVSRDGVAWRAIRHDYVTTDETSYVRDRAAWVGFGGKTPVLLDTTTNPVDPFDQTAAGGDSFDLDDIVGDDAEAAAMRADGITQVRLTTAPSRVNPDTGATYVFDTHSNGADLDGVFGRYVRDGEVAAHGAR